MAHWLDGDDWKAILRDELLPGHYSRSGHLDATDTFYGPALESIQRGQAVQVTADGILLVSSAEGVIAGIALMDVIPGDKCPYATRGFVFVESWEDAIGQPHLVTGHTYFLTEMGRLADTPPITGYIVPVGLAHSPHILDVAIGTKIKLE